jgi:hypothetical protein
MLAGETIGNRVGTSAYTIIGRGMVGIGRGIVGTHGLINRAPTP